MRRLVMFATMGLAVLAAAAAPAGAAVEVNESVPFNDFEVFIPCANGGAGDTVTLNGRLHVLITFTINRNHLSGTDHFQPQDLRGTDTEGHAYHGVGITRDAFSASLVNGQFNTTFVNNFYIVGTAGAPSYRAHETFHITVTAKGKLTAFQDHIRVTCR
jgi:hypothetical protein